MRAVGSHAEFDFASKVKVHQLGICSSGSLKTQGNKKRFLWKMKRVQINKTLDIWDSRALELKFLAFISSKTDKPDSQIKTKKMDSRNKDMKRDALI